MDKSLSYKLKCINEDFQVTEVSLMPSFISKGSRKFTYIWLQKSGFTTFEVLEQIKVFFKLSFEDVSCQGLKDEEAITEQLLSVKKVLSEKDIKAFNKKHTFKNKFAKIKYIVGYGEKPIKERALHGNAFKIVVRNLNSTFADNLLNYIWRFYGRRGKSSNIFDQYSDFSKVSAIRDKWFAKSKPVSTLLEVNAMTRKGAKIEIEVTAVIKK